TMREVIKIAFRRENINVIACHDAASAFNEIEQVTPYVVITDFIMPDKDGYEVCQYIKQHPKFANTPVILMSGVVNRTVAERAFAVKADELIRKPFQPQDLITRVKHLLNPKAPVTQQAPEAATAALSSIFGQAAAPARAPASMDVTKLRLEIMRLENLVKKLQSELEAERQYSRALEEHVKTLSEGE